MIAKWTNSAYLEAGTEAEVSWIISW
jgi:hypothetical protein